ncbi:MAG: preprotein translocase subunit YajC [Micavibrio sp.]|nr:preprotein translocase subunit YajC [Micavibrio sp.]
MTEVGADGSIPEAPSASEAFIMNLGMVLLLVVMFYLLLIKPQQKRLKEHSNMLQDLKKGDSVVTGGGLVGVIDKIKPGDPEVVVDLGGSKVTALRSTLQGKSDIFLKAENDKKAVKKDATKSEEPVKK